MIRMRLMGGLGNQLFQWACARSLQKLYGHPLQFDDHIALSSRNRDIVNFPNIVWSVDELIKDKYKQPPEMYEMHTDSFNINNFYQINFENNNLIHLSGYWQGVDYFKSAEEEVRACLEPTEEFINKHQISKSTVSLHLRRTDYIGKDNYHPIPSMKYYEKALTMVDYDDIFVFSDDITWCKENLKFKNMTFIHNENPIDDLWIMSLCGNNIIANSTFSWWAAWLNNNPDKKVIMPKKWFGPCAPSDKDITNVDWIKLTDNGEVVE